MTILEMTNQKLHEVAFINTLPRAITLRVPGGWIYTIAEGGTTNSVFVPFPPLTWQRKGDPPYATADDRPMPVQTTQL